MTIDWIELVLKILGALHIEHVSYKRALRAMECAKLSCFNREIIVLLGPTRAGKTRILRQSLGARPGLEPDENGHMPVLYVEAGNDSKSGTFSTKNFYHEALTAIWHTVYGLQSVAEIAKPDRALLASSEWQMQVAFRRALVHRKTRYFVIDEAHHVRYAARSDEVAMRILDGFKSLANRVDCTLVLCGSYALLDLLACSPHFCGRTHVVEMPRYRDNKADLAAFAQVLKTLNQHLVFEEQESLLSWAAELYQGSLGCVGSLTKWIRAALGVCLLRESSVLRWEHFEASRLPASMRSAIETEIVAGEAIIGRVADQLKADSTKGPDSPSEPEKPPKRRPASRAKQSDKARTAKRKPFQRKTRRNPLGERD